MFVRSVVVERHPVAKGLAGGRFRSLAGESAADLLCQKVAREARVEVTGCEALPPVVATSVRYRLTLRSRLPGHHGGGHAEGTIVVSVRRVELPHGGE